MTLALTPADPLQDLIRTATRGWNASERAAFDACLERLGPLPPVDFAPEDEPKADLVDEDLSMNMELAIDISFLVPTLLSDLEAIEAVHRLFRRVHRIVRLFGTQCPRSW